MSPAARTGLVAFACAVVIVGSLLALVLSGGAGRRQAPRAPAEVYPTAVPARGPAAEAVPAVPAALPAPPDAGDGRWEGVLGAMTDRAGGALVVNAEGRFAHVLDVPPPDPRLGDMQDLVSLQVLRLRYPALEELGEDVWLVPLPQTPGLRLSREQARRVLADVLRRPTLAELGRRRTALDDLLEGGVRLPGGP